MQSQQHYKARRRVRRGAIVALAAAGSFVALAGPSSASETAAAATLVPAWSTTGAMPSLQELESNPMAYVALDGTPRTFVYQSADATGPTDLQVLQTTAPAELAGLDEPALSRLSQTKTGVASSSDIVTLVAAAPTVGTAVDENSSNTAAAAQTSSGCPDIDNCRLIQYSTMLSGSHAGFSPVFDPTYFTFHTHQSEIYQRHDGATDNIYIFPGYPHFFDSNGDNWNTHFRNTHIGPVGQGPGAPAGYKGSQVQSDADGDWAPLTIGFGKPPISGNPNEYIKSSSCIHDDVTNKYGTRSYNDGYYLASHYFLNIFISQGNLNVAPGCNSMP